MAPGPGARASDIFGFRRCRTKLCRQPLFTIPHHCSQITGVSGSEAWFPRFCLWNVVSSASTSHHFFPFPKLTCFSCSCTHFMRGSRSRLSMSSIALWFTPSNPWITGCGTRFSKSSRSAACNCKDVEPEPLPSTKSGWRWWGFKYTWQAFALQRYLGKWPLLFWSLDSEPLPQRGQTLPSHAQSKLSCKSKLTILWSKAPSNSWMVLFHLIRS